MASPITIQVKEVGKADELLSRLPIELREKTLVNAIRKAGKIVAKEAERLAPKPGYPGDKPGKLPLNQSVKIRIRSLTNATIGFIGPEYPKAPHGHLVEYGHEIQNPKDGGKTHTVKNPFMRRAADTTEREQQTAIIDTLKKEVEKYRG